MSIQQICEVDVLSLAHDDCVMWLWTTNLHMREAFGVLDAWGFRHVTIVTWAKDRMGFGLWLRNQTEHCLFAVRGKPIVNLTTQTTILNAPSCAGIRKSRASFTIWSKASARHRAMPICSPATAITPSGIATVMKRRQRWRQRNDPPRKAPEPPQK